MIDVVEMAPTHLASVKQRIAWPELAVKIRAGFDRIYAFLRAAGVKPTGHNVCVYRDKDRSGCELECGVQVGGPFTEGDGVENSATPSGRAAHIVHIGSYDKIHLHGAELDAFRGGRDAGVDWEVYGDWTDDPAQLRTDIYRLLAAE